MENILNICSEGIYVVDYYTCEILLINDKMAQYLGKGDTAGLIGKTCWKSFNQRGSGRCPFCPHNKLLDSEGRPARPYTWEEYIAPLGKWVRVTNQALEWPGGRLVQMVSFADITETKMMRERLERLKYTDAILDLKNEISLEQDMTEPYEKPSMIIVKALTLQRTLERYGREIKDHLLRTMRDWLLSLSMPESELYFVSGDKFCITVKNVDSYTLRHRADAISQHFSEPQILDYYGSRFQMFSKVSVAVIPGAHIRDKEPLLSMIEKNCQA